jgi:superoxide reductase
MIGLIKDKGVPMMCCGQKMKELIPNTTEASTEKHLPAITDAVNGIDVQVGSVPHPMEEEHHISFIYVETERGGQRKCLKPGMEPKSGFSFVDDTPKDVYAYCNLHGLWKTEV